ncbi:Rho guanine nucleotide exchange factor 3, variant 2 [Balamuthia mandrillaris]
MKVAMQKKKFEGKDDLYRLLTKQMDVLAEQLAAKDAQLLEKDKQLASKDEQIKALSQQLSKLQEALNQKDEALALYFFSSASVNSKPKKEEKENGSWAKRVIDLENQCSQLNNSLNKWNSHTEKETAERTSQLQLLNGRFEKLQQQVKEQIATATTAALSNEKKKEKNEENSNGQSLTGTNSAEFAEDSPQAINLRLRIIESDVEAILKKLITFEQTILDQPSLNQSEASTIADSTTASQDLASSSSPSSSPHSMEDKAKKKLKLPLHMKRQSLSIRTLRELKDNASSSHKLMRVKRKGSGGDASSDVYDPSSYVPTMEDATLRSIPLHTLIKDKFGIGDIERKLELCVDELHKADSSGETALHVLCKANGKPRMDLFQCLLAHDADVNVVDNFGRTPLISACMVKEGMNGELIQALVKAGANVLNTDLEDIPPLHYFARQAPDADHLSVYEKTLSCLLENGADMNYSVKGETALHNAAQHSSWSVIEIFLRKGANIYAETDSGETVLHKAILARNNHLIEKLFEVGVDPRPSYEGGTVETSTSQSPLKLARSLGFEAKATYDLVKDRIAKLDMQYMSENQQKNHRRMLAIEELVLTEEEYIHDLGVLLEVFVRPLEQNLFESENNKTQTRILSQEEMKNIFGNVSALYEVNQSFFHDLKEAFEKHSPSRKGEEDHIAVGSIFLSHMKKLEVYQKVCVQQQTSDEFLQAALKKFNFKDASPVMSSGSTIRRSKNLTHGTSEFARFCEEAKRDKRCRNMDLSSFLIKPFQRVTKYPLLLKEIGYYTAQTHPDYETTKKAKAELEVMIGAANDKKRASDNICKILEIQSSILWEPPESMIKLGTDRNRLYINEGAYSVARNGDKFIKRYVYLLSDMVIVTQAQGKKKKTVAHKKLLYQFHIPFDLRYKLCDISDGTLESGKAVKSAFAIQPVDENKYYSCARVVFNLKDNDAKRTWMKAISDSLARNIEPVEAKASESSSRGSVIALRPHPSRGGSNWQSGSTIRVRGDGPSSGLEAPLARLQHKQSHGHSTLRPAKATSAEELDSSSTDSNSSTTSNNTIVLNKKKGKSGSVILGRRKTSAPPSSNAISHTSNLGSGGSMRHKAPRSPLPPTPPSSSSSSSSSLTPPSSAGTSPCASPSTKRLRSRSVGANPPVTVAPSPEENNCRGEILHSHFTSSFISAEHSLK